MDERGILGEGDVFEALSDGLHLRGDGPIVGSDPSLDIAGEQLVEGPQMGETPLVFQDALGLVFGRLRNLGRLPSPRKFSK